MIPKVLHRERFPLTQLWIVVILLVPATSLGTEAENPAGHWKGAVEILGTKLEVRINLEHSAAGWKGKISIPAQNAKDLPLNNVTVADAEITFDLPGMPGSPSFRGTMSDDRRQISGDFTQFRQTFRFLLERSEDLATAAEQALAGLDGLIQQALGDWMVPGLAVGIVTDDEIVYARGFGMRDVGQKLPVTTKTLFAIGSCTKAFTTFVMGTLVDEGKLDWDRPVADYLPGFKLYDEYASGHITPRDLVTHRSGLPRHDLVWYNNLTLSRKQLVERLRYLEPNEDLRAKWQYNNLMFVTAGYLAGQLTGGTWEEAVRTRVFKPLDMSNTNFSVEESRKSDDFALPYEEKDDQLREMAFRNITTVGPAGSVNSNIDDMIKWIRVHLNRGKAGERRILSEATAQDLHTPYMVISVLPEEPEVSPGSYALGWMTDTYRGHYRVRHGGGIDGFTALVTLYPRDGVGMVVLANKSGTGLPGLVTLHGSDLALGLAYKDWNGEALAKWKTAKQAQKEAEEKARTLRKTGTKPAHPLEAYAGDYEHPGYGILQINVQDQQLAMGFNGITTSLEHWHYETFNGLENPVDRTFEDVKLTFRTNQRGNVEAVSAPFDPLVPEIVFTRKAEDRMSDPQYLRRFVGVYELLDKEITIGIEGCVLTLYVPGQPVYELVPDREDEFKLKGLAGFSVRFETSEDGTIKAFINQPNGVFEVTRKSPK